MTRLKRWFHGGALAACIMASAPAHSQSLPPETLQRGVREIGRLEAKWRADRSALTFGDLNAAAPAIWASADKHAILRLQNLWITIALRDRDTPREIGGRIIALLVHHTVNGVASEDAAWAYLALGQAYLKDAANLRDGAHYALVNAIAITEALERAEKTSDDAVQIHARASALLGQSLLQSDRPGAALHHLRSAQSLVERARFSPANRAGVEQLLAVARSEMNAGVAPMDAVSCPPAALSDVGRTSACMRVADRMWSAGDIAGVEALIAGLTSEVRCGSVRAEEMEAFRHLHFARLLRHGQQSDELSFTTCGLSGRLSGEGLPAWAAVVAWPLIHSHIHAERFEQRIADVAAHAARRFMRDNNDALAWLALEATQAYLQSAAKAKDEPSPLVRLRRALMQPALAFDAAYIAERNGWSDLGEFHARIGRNAAERSDPAAIETILDALGDFFDEGYGFKVPTPAGAMELFARIARRLPATNDHHRQTAVVWPRLEQLYRSDDARAAKVAAENLTLYRKQPDADPETVSALLQTYADVIGDSEPDKSLAARREALEILSALPGGEAMRIDLLFEIESDRRGLGDTAGAATYFEQAVAIRQSGVKIDPRIAARVDMRLAVRKFNEGDRSGARALAESALASVIAATQKPGAEWARYGPAKTLAEIFAADGDLPRARAIYETHVLPVTDKAVATGDAVPIQNRLELASLEALHGPTADTVKTINDLLALAQRRVANAKDLQERGWRSLAIAHLGLNDGAAALNAARRAFALKPAINSDVKNEASDRRLSETFVAAAWRAADPQAAHAR